MQLSLGFPDLREQPMVKRIQAPEEPTQPHSSPYHGSHSPQDRSGLAGGTLSGEVSPLGGSLLSFLLLLQATEAAAGNGGGLQSTDEPVIPSPTHRWCSSA